MNGGMVGVSFFLRFGGVLCMSRDLWCVLCLQVVLNAVRKQSKIAAAAAAADVCINAHQSTCMHA